MSPDPFAAAPTLREALATSRQFLLAIANAELPPGLRAKGGASDLVQDTLSAAYEARHQFRGQTVAELNGWLRAILVRELAMMRRKFVDTASRDVRREVGAMPPDLATKSLDPANDLIRRERDEQLATAIARLPHDYRSVIVLRAERGLSFAAIGEQLGRTEDAARRLFSRAIQLLRTTTPGASA